MAPARQAQVAQLVEQRTENPRVGSSILSLGTIPYEAQFLFRLLSAAKCRAGI
jgi:hypothetical protein